MKKNIPLAVVEGNREKRKKKLFSLIQKNKGQALLLVPEVAMLDAYRDYGTIYHTGLRASEKKSIWSGVYDETIRVVIGTQKALFLPFQNLATICVDEEQYESYKLWDQYPRLHTVRGAGELAKVHGADMVYASSYPSVALRYAVSNNRCKKMTWHPLGLATEIIPFSFEDRKWKRAIPRDAVYAIRKWARGGKKILLLYNKKENTAIRKTLYGSIPKQAKSNIAFGTTALFSRPDLGTFDHVVWMSPELTMNAIDYRSSERARMIAARLQALAPRNPVMVITKRAEYARRILGSDDDMWYEETLRERRLLHLPPYTDIVRLTIRGTSEVKAHARANDIVATLEEALKNNKTARVFGPFQERGRTESKRMEYHILLSGVLDDLTAAYRNLPIDIADVDPHRIV